LRSAAPAEKPQTRLVVLLKAKNICGLLEFSRASIDCGLARCDATSAIRFHVETFGAEVLDIDPLVLDAFVAEAPLER
jgi:hypothetical protein